MTHLNENKQALRRRAQFCAESLRRLIHQDDDAGRKLLENELGLLAEQAIALDFEAFGQVGDCIGRVFSRSMSVDPYLKDLENKSLALAADWLEQLGCLCHAGLPEPKGMLADLIYGFALIEQAVRARDEAGAHHNAADPFAADPAVVSELWERYAKDTDPFSDDPSLVPLLDLLQRTLAHARYISEARAVDPFTDDPELPAAEAVACDDKSDVNRQPSEDPFAADPPVSID